jgi:hypothetical protein
MFVLDNLKKTLIDTNLCGISEFQQKFHTNLCRLTYFSIYPTPKFVFRQHKIPVAVFKHKVCVAVTQTFLECTLPNNFRNDHHERDISAEHLMIRSKYVNEFAF